MHAPRSCAILAALLLGGCGGGGDAAQELDTIASWTATARMAVAQHHSGAITTTYARQLHTAADEALASSRSTLHSMPMTADTARLASAALDSLGRAIHSLDVETAP